MNPEFRVFLRPRCIVNPWPRAEAASLTAALFAPKVIEYALDGVATLLKKAGDDETEQVTGSEFTSLYVADAEQRLAMNPALGCIVGVYGTFAPTGRPTPPADSAVLALEREGVVPANVGVAIVFEAAILPTADGTAFHLETRHFSVREFIGDRKKPDRTYVVTLSVTTPSATPDGSTIALGNIALGRVGKDALPIAGGSAPGAYPRFHSNLMPWKRITIDAREAYEWDVRRNAAANRPYMPVTFSLTLSETADGNRFLATLGQLLQESKGAVATPLSDVLSPDARNTAEQARADASEKLLATEEDARIAAKEAEAALAAGRPEQKEVLALKLARARRALDVAVSLRKAAGLPDLPSVS